MMHLSAFRSRLRSFFIPSFLSPRPARSVRATSSSHHGGISSLDGLRGIACLVVVNEHVFYNYTLTFLTGYGVAGKVYVVQWPFVRIFWCGTSMVNIFFVISGYVLSYKPLLYLHKGDQSTARAVVASSTFRRIPRLYLPMWTMVLICGLMVRLGLFDRSVKLWNMKDAEMKNNPYGFNEGPPLLFNSSWPLIKDVMAKIWHTLNIFTMTDKDIHAEHYDRHTWTIPVEFRSSMILFTVVAATSQFKMRYRMVIVILVGTVVMTMRQKFTMMFLTGVVLADVDHRVRSILHRVEHDYPPTGKSRPERFIATLLHPSGFTYPICFMIGIYLLCVPIFHSSLDRFYSLLIRLVPLQSYNEPDVWLRYYGSVMAVWAVANSTRLKPIFVHPISLYLGKISYALYLVHGDIIRSLLYAAIPSIYKITGDGIKQNQTATQMVVSMLLGWFLVVPLSIYLADLFMRGVDVPLTTLSRRMEIAMSESPKDHQIPSI